jgi:predicted RNA-binding protein YlqC (UPF0109 family)
LPSSARLFCISSHLQQALLSYFWSPRRLREATHIILNPAAMAEQFKDQEFIEYVVKSIVNHPEDVKSERTIDERGVLITLHINQEDMGYVIGRQGQTARALRILLKIVGAKEDARVNLKIYEPDGARQAHRESLGAAATSEESAPAAPQRHGEANLVTDADLADLGI